SGTEFAARRGDDVPSQQYSKRQSVGYEEKRHVGSQDKIASAQQAWSIRERYAASQVEGKEQVRRSEGIESPGQHSSRRASQGGQSEQSQNGRQEITIRDWLSKCGRQLWRHNTRHHKRQSEEPEPMQQQDGLQVLVAGAFL